VAIDLSVRIHGQGRRSQNRRSLYGGSRVSRQLPQLRRSGPGSSSPAATWATSCFSPQTFCAAKPEARTRGYGCSVLDLAEFNPVAAQFDLVVHAPRELDTPPVPGARPQVR
jgi:hypothetical protein